MAFLLGGWSKTDVDDINDLPLDLRDMYLNPWKILGLARAGAPWELRDAFRQRCLNMTPHFVGLQAPARYSFRQVLFAYRMCTGELAGPTSKLSRCLDTSPLLQNTDPWDILNTLRPLASKGMYVGPSARASKMLAVELKSATTAFGGKGVGAIPQVSFTMKVSYCMRIHEVERFHSDFERLNRRLAMELTVLPTFPEGGGIASVVGGKQELGRELCTYVQRVHTLLSQRGVFSPRLMEFLKVDYGRVHIEEEGRVVSENLDGRSILPDTCWQVVEEGWLVRWRRFVLGRGARRYHAPGEIDNWSLLSSPRDKSETPLDCAKEGVGGTLGDEGGVGRRRGRDGALGGEGGGAVTRAVPREVDERTFLFGHVL